ncbi:MAG: hypothetical protein C0490_08915 [Marivirga sp.]|nr:hypothetical protein [Marivirga sp.]
MHPSKKSVISIQSFIPTDYNRDNKMDILLSGVRNNNPLTVVYINKGNFEFEEKQVSAATHSLMKFADLDNDARPEWLVSGMDNGGYYVRILKRESELQWKTVHDTLKINATALDVVDANDDGNFDVFISGKVNPDSLVSAFLINKNDLYFKPYLAVERAGVTSTGDTNLDGTFDVLFMGQDKNNVLATSLYESSDVIYTIKNDPHVLKEPKPFVADLNSDGNTDTNYRGKSASNDTLNFIQYAAQDYDTLNSKKLIDQSFGDVEHDGDLDLVQVIRNNTIHIVFYENRPGQKNLGPGTPKNAIAVNVFNRVFMYWEKPADDHTPTQSLTYDLYLNGNPDYQAGDFDILNEKRLLPGHGNNSTENFRLFKHVSSSNFGFAVQAVDNSLHAGIPCMGNRSACVNVSAEELSACSNEEFNIASPPGSLWFSFSKGFLGIASEFKLQAEKKDTVFYYDPHQPGCTGLKVWTVKIKNDTLKTEVSELYACQDADLQFTAEPGWENVNWKSQLKGELGSANTIAYKLLQPDSIILTLSNSLGCTIVRKTALKISKPALQLNGDNFKILKGSDVQLSASGAQTYQWTPATGLNKVDIANPVASPTASIQYLVTGYDSLGCTDKASVHIIVEGAGFIPNLFTPNDDGKNDELKIYGLTSVKDFTFTIHNREGSVVYKTSDISEAVQRGWDGSKNGTKQPAGVYFWKVKGEVLSGGRILLNGKDAGSIVLVR